MDICVDMQSRVAEMTKQYLQRNGRFFYVTPTSYLALIKTFQSLVKKKQDEVWGKKLRYDNGLTKLAETAEQVAIMQAELKALQPKLVIAQSETAEMLITIDQMTKEANKTEAIVAKEAAACAKQAAAANAIKTDCEEKLAVAIPG